MMSARRNRIDHGRTRIGHRSKGLFDRIDRMNRILGQQNPAGSGLPRRGLSEGGPILSEYWFCAVLWASKVEVICQGKAQKIPDRVAVRKGIWQERSQYTAMSVPG